MPFDSRTIPQSPASAQAEKTRVNQEIKSLTAATAVNDPKTVLRLRYELERARINSDYACVSENAAANARAGGLASIANGVGTSLLVALTPETAGLTALGIVALPQITGYIEAKVRTSNNKDKNKCEAESEKHWIEGNSQLALSESSLYTVMQSAELHQGNLNREMKQQKQVRSDGAGIKESAKNEKDDWSSDRTLLRNGASFAAAIAKWKLNEPHLISAFGNDVKGSVRGSAIKLGAGVAVAGLAIEGMSYLSEQGINDKVRAELVKNAEAEYNLAVGRLHRSGLLEKNGTMPNISGMPGVRGRQNGR